MESQQDIVDLTINDDDDCFFLNELLNKMATAKKNHESVNACKSEDGESVYGSEDGEITAKQNQEDDILSVYGSEDGEITANQNQEDDTLSCYGSEDGEIASKEEEKEDSKKIIFKRIWPNVGKKPRKAMPQSAAFDVYSCSHKTIYPGQMERFSLGFKMKMPKGYCAKIYGRSGMTVKHGIHLAGGVSIIEPDFRGPISICLKNSHRSHPYEIKVNDRVAQMMIERVDDFKWIEGTENDFKTEGMSENTSEASENASEAQCGMKRIKKLEGFRSTGI